MSVESPQSDAQLLHAVRRGDADAYRQLHERHAAAARALAAQLVPGGTEAEDVVAESFTRVLDEVGRGGGPESAFRTYLLVVVRQTVHDRTRLTADAESFEPVMPDPVSTRLEGALLAQAYQSLPERWRAVLWHTEVENARSADVAPLLGLSANGVAALAYRAREGLRQAYLQVYLTGSPPQECKTVLGKLGAYVRGGLTRRDTRAVDEHVRDCPNCRTVLRELTDVNRGLRTVVGPLVLGGAAAGYLAAMSRPAPVPGVLARLRATPRRRLVLAGGAATVMAVAATFAVISGQDVGARPPAARPGSPYDHVGPYGEKDSALPAPGDKTPDGAADGGSGSAEAKSGATGDSEPQTSGSGSQTPSGGPPIAQGRPPAPAQAGASAGKGDQAGNQEGDGAESAPGKPDRAGAPSASGGPHEDPAGSTARKQDGAASGSAAGKRERDRSGSAPGGRDGLAAGKPGGDRGGSAPGGRDGLAAGKPGGDRGGSASGGRDGLAAGERDGEGSGRPDRERARVPAREKAGASGRAQGRPRLRASVTVMGSLVRGESGIVAMRLRNAGDAPTRDVYAAVELPPGVTLATHAHPVAETPLIAPQKPGAVQWVATRGRSQALLPSNKTTAAHPDDRVLVLPALSPTPQKPAAREAGSTRSRATAPDKQESPQSDPATGTPGRPTAVQAVADASVAAHGEQGVGAGAATPGERHAVQWVGTTSGKPTAPRTAGVSAVAPGDRERAGAVVPGEREGANAVVPGERVVANAVVPGERVVANAVVPDERVGAVVRSAGPEAKDEWRCRPVRGGARCARGPLNPGQVTSVFLRVRVAGDAPLGARPELRVEAGELRLSARAKEGVREEGAPARFAADGKVTVRAVGNGLLTCSDEGCAKRRDLRPMDRDRSAKTDVSSAARLTLPRGGRIVWAGLYWSATAEEAGPIRLKPPGRGGYVTVRPSRVAWQELPDGPAYQAFADVTGLAATAGGDGMWWAADPPMGEPGHAGWSLVVVTTDPAAPYGNALVLDDARVVGGEGPVLRLPLGGLAPGGQPARVELVAWEGDAGLRGDRVSLGSGPVRPTGGGRDAGDVFDGSANGASGRASGVDVDTFRDRLPARPRLTIMGKRDVVLFGVAAVSVRARP